MLSSFVQIASFIYLTSCIASSFENKNAH